MNEHDLIKPSEEPAVRLVVFTVALLAISIRERTQNPILEHPSLAPVWESEARTIADSVVAEAKRLSET